MSGLSGWETRELRGTEELAARRALLSSRGLSVPGGEDRILGIFEQDRLVATGSISGKTLVGIAVDRSIEGEGGAAAILSALISSAVASGLEHLFLFTSSKEAGRFADLGFSPVSSVPGGAALLEWGRPRLEDWLGELKRSSEGKPRGAGAVVVNCNPFTLGHRKLIEFASANSPWLYVLVVEEDRSIFPFPVRHELVKRGTADIPNLSVLPGGPYIVSSATFPTYFIRPEPGKVSEAAVAMHADLDLAIFREHVAPALSLATRYVGTEPYCPTTAAYNRAMKSILVAGAASVAASGRASGTASGAASGAANGTGLGAGLGQGSGQAAELPGPPLDVVEMPRFLMGGVAVSASRVRDLLRSGRLAEAKALLPGSTAAWLDSSEAVPVLERLRASDSRH